MALYASGCDCQEILPHARLQVFGWAAGQERVAHRVAVVAIVDVLGYDVEKHLHLAALVMNRAPQ